MSDLPFKWDRTTLGVRILSRNGGVRIAEMVEEALINEVERLTTELEEARASAQRRDRGLRCGLSAVRSTLTTHVERHTDPHLQDALDSVTRMLAKVTNTALEGKDG